MMKGWYDTPMKAMQTLQDITTRLESYGQQTCFLQMESNDTTHCSCTEIATAATRLAHGLVKAGLKSGEYVPILAHNRPEWVVAALAVINAGGAVCPLDSQIRTDALDHILRSSEPRFIFTTTEYVHRIQRFELAVTPRLILFDVPADDERGWQIMATDENSPLPGVTPDDPAVLFFTSGTTGLPKGVPLTHRNIVFQIQSLQESGLVTPQDRALLPLPMYHVYPFTVGTLTPLSLGVPIILPQSLTGPQVTRALREGEVTIIVGVPRLYRAVYNGIEGQVAARGKIAQTLFQTMLNSSIWLRRNFGWQVGKKLFRSVHSKTGPNLRVVASGGSPLDPELAWKLEGLGWNVAIGYGLTETSPILTVNLPARKPKLGSAGLPLSGVDIRIDTTVGSSEEDGSAPDRSPNQGEILAKGTSVFGGYRNLPEQTQNVFNAEGWFRTGDLGYFDAAGYLYINGRASTLIVTEGGKNIQPEPLEEMYQAHMFIREIGILHHDNQLVALIVPELEEINWHRNGDVERAIHEAVDERLRAVPSYQRITDYAVSSEPLPRTNLGKIQRHKLAQFYKLAQQGAVPQDAATVGPLLLEDMSEQDQTLLSHEAARQVWDWLVERYPDKRLTPDSSPQIDLGIDSLAWLTLTLEIGERTGVELSEDAIARVSSVRDLLTEVWQAAEADPAETVSLTTPEVMLTPEQTQWLSPKGPVLAFLGYLMYLFLNTVGRFYFGLKTHGLDNLPEEGGFVLTPNHASFLDAPILAAALPYKYVRRIYWAAAANMMFANPLLRFVSRTAQVFPIEHQRSGSGLKNLALGALVLKQEKNLIWFPEGQVTRTGGLLPFQQGIGLLLEAHPKQVVPVYIEGTREALPRGNYLPRPKPIAITFGTVCQPEDLARQGEGETLYARIASGLQAEVAGLNGRDTATRST